MKTNIILNVFYSVCGIIVTLCIIDMHIDFSEKCLWLLGVCGYFGFTYYYFTHTGLSPTEVVEETEVGEGS